MTIQVSFSEYPLAGTGMFYEFILTNTGNTERVYLGLFGNGFVNVRGGPAVGFNKYSGTWTPNQGTHTIQIDIDVANNITLYIDGVSIPLTPGGGGALPGGPLPGNVFQISSSPDSDVNINASAVYTKAFIATGNLPASTAFCCP